MHYQIDASRSRLVVQAFANDLLSAFGHNPKIALRDFAGEAEFELAAPAKAALQISVQAESLAVIDDMSAHDRHEIEHTAREEILDATHYPEIVFQSADIQTQPIAENLYQARINGELTLRGVTRACVIDAQLTFTRNGLRAQGGLTLRQTDFNLGPITIAVGIMKLKDEAELSFDILAQAQPE